MRDERADSLRCALGDGGIGAKSEEEKPVAMGRLGS